MPENPPAPVLKYWIILIALSLIFSGYVSGSSAAASAEDIQEVVAEGRAMLGEDTTPSQAKTLALNEARRIAVERASGVRVRSSSVVYNSELICDLISTFAKGLIVKEDVLSEGLRTEDGRVVYICRIKAFIKPIRQTQQKKVRITLAEIARVDRPFSSSFSLFQDNDEIRIKVRTEGDLHLYIFSVSQDGRVAVLLPTPMSDWKRYRAGRILFFPTKL